jgi:TonB family protein
MASLCKLEDFASTFALYIDELHDFFRSRNVRFGSAEDVAAVVERLSRDDAFRDDMASMIRAIIYRERDGLAPIELFELMVVAVGDPRAEEGSEEIRDSAAQLLAFVRGVCHSRWKTDVDAHGGFEAAGETVDQSPAELDERSKGLERGVGTAEAEELRSGRSEIETASSSADPSANIREMHNSALFYRARVVAAERHEPEWPVGSAASMEPAATKVEAAPIEVEAPVERMAARSEAAPVTARRPFVKWSTFRLPTVNWPAFTWPSVTLPAVRWPTLSLSRLGRVGSGPRRWVWGAGLCALGIAVSAGFWLHDGAGMVATPVRRVARSPKGGLAAGRKPSPAVENVHDGDVAAMISAAVQRGRNSAGDQSDALDVVGSSETPAANGELSEEGLRSARPQPVRQQEEERPVTSEPSVQPAQPAAAPVAAASGPRPVAPEKTFAESAGRTGGGGYSVAPAVMLGRLLYAPRLQYPMLAKVAHVEGTVVVEAVVGQDGWVTAARILSGHRLLRGAALSAVRGRRYRPYTVNDKPMEVATIVAVDFRLK